MTVTLVLVSVIIALVTIGAYKMHRHMSYWKDLGIPHDKPSWVKGNLQGLRITRGFYDVFKETYDKYKGTGPFCGFYFGHRPAAVVLDLQLVKDVLITDFSNFVDRGLFHNEEDDPLTGHLVLVDGQKWRTLRSKLTPTFSSGKMKLMYPTIVKVAHQFVDAFGDMVHKSETVEIRELLARFTTDVIGTCAFGLECNSLKDPEAEFRVMGRRFFSEKRHHPLVLNFMHGAPKLARKLRMRLTPDDVSDFFLKIVRDTVDYRRKNNVQRNDFMSILMELSSQKDGLTIEEMAAQVFVFFAAGFESSATTMGFALYEMALNQRVQDKVRSEVNEMLKKHNNEMSYEWMHDLTYMGQVILETVRKYSITAQLHREAMNDYPVPGHPKYVIKKGMPIIIPVVGFHTDPEIFPNPDQFDPDRFTPAQVAQRDSAAFLGFGVGPRNCIGTRFGQMQSRIGLAMLLKHFRFSAAKDTEMPIIRDVTVFISGPKNGIRLKVERI